MTDIVSLEFLIAVLFIIDVFFVLLLLLFAKRINQRVNQMGSGQMNSGSGDGGSDSKPALESAREILDLLEPLVTESRRTAASFDQQIREKRKLSRDLNDALDTRIISINLLLSRADSLQKKLEDRQATIQQSAPALTPPAFRTSNVLDQQNQILDLYHQRQDIDTIAEKLSIPKGEVQLVIDLKEKFIAMEKGQ
jgi:Family of unknown function (DUF6115)